MVAPDPCTEVDKLRCASMVFCLPGCPYELQLRTTTGPRRNFSAGGAVLIYRTYSRGVCH